MKVMVVGAGKLGYKLAESMVSEGIDITVVDRDIEVIDMVNEHIDVYTVHGNGMDIELLKELDIKSYGLLVAVTSNDEANALICSLGKKMGCRKTVARIRERSYMKQIEFIKSELGIDYIVNPDLATAMAIERILLKSHSFHFGGFASGKVQIIDFNIEDLEDFVGKKLMDIEVFDEELLIAAISRDGEIIIPNGNTVLNKNDVIYVIGKSTNIIKIAEMFSEGLDRREIERVMILGGSNIAYYLASRLSRQNIHITIIEKDKNKCLELSEALDNTLVIHGDGTDIHLLEDERISTMDAFVGVTGFDESNLLMGLMAKQSGVPRAISKISRDNYAKIIDRLGIDAALNPIYITASNILKLIRGGKIVSVSLLIGGDGEVTEIILDKDLSIINKTLDEIDIPDGIIIGTLVRNGEVIIPSGKTILKANDRVIVFSLAEDLKNLKKLFYRDKKEGGRFSELWNRGKANR